MTPKENGLARCANSGQGLETENQIYGYSTIFRVTIKYLIVEAASRDLIPPSWVTFALRVLRLEEE